MNPKQVFLSACLLPALYCVASAGSYSPSKPQGGGIIASLWPGGTQNDVLFATNATTTSCFVLNTGYDISVHGSISFTYTWQGSGAPPGSVILKYTGSMERGGDTSSSNTVDDGLGHPNVRTTNTPYDYRSTSSGTKYEVKPNPGTSFTATITPHGTATTGYITAGFSVAVTPVQVAISGTTQVGNALQALIGQKQAASISAGGYQLTSIQWSAPMESYEGASWQNNFTTPSGTDDGHHYISLTSGDLHQNPMSYYTLAPTSTLVYASACVILPDGTSQTVSGQSSVDVVAPDYGFGIIGNGVTSINQSGTDFTIASGDNSSRPTAGALFAYRVAPLSPFNDSANSICYLSQLIKPQVTSVDASGQQSSIMWRDSFVQDTCRVYESDGPYVVDNALHASGHQTDTPFIAFLGAGLASVNIAEDFKMFLIYSAPASSAGSSINTPLRVLDWQWHTSASKEPSTGLWALTGGNPTSGGSRDFPYDEWQWGDYWSPDHM